MSYREVPVEVEEEQEEDDLGDEDGEDVIEVEGEAQLPVSAYSADEPQDDSGRPVLSRSVSASAPTPGRRARSAMPAFNSDEDDKSYGRPNLEKVGSGRGGFSVKGAASAAARARWDRVRKEKAERGDESDEGDRVKRIRMPGKKDSRAAAESFDSELNNAIQGVH